METRNEMKYHFNDILKISRTDTIKVKKFTKKIQEFFFIISKKNPFLVADFLVDYIPENERKENAILLIMAVSFNYTFNTIPYKIEFFLSSNEECYHAFIKNLSPGSKELSSSFLKKTDDLYSYLLLYHNQIKKS